MKTSASIAQLMDDEYLIAALRTEQLSPLEAHLLDRLEALVEDRTSALEFVDIANEYEIEAEDMQLLLDSHGAPLKEKAEILAWLFNEGIHTVEQLEKEFDHELP